MAPFVFSRAQLAIVVSRCSVAAAQPEEGERCVDARTADQRDGARRGREGEPAAWGEGPRSGRGGRRNPVS